MIIISILWCYCQTLSGVLLYVKGSEQWLTLYEYSLWRVERVTHSINHSLGVLLLSRTQMSAVRVRNCEVSGKPSPGGLILCWSKALLCDLLAVAQWGIRFSKGSTQRWLLQSEMLYNQIPSIPAAKQKSGHRFGNTKRCQTQEPQRVAGNCRMYSLKGSRHFLGHEQFLAGFQKGTLEKIRKIIYHSRQDWGIGRQTFKILWITLEDARLGCCKASDSLDNRRETW